MLRIRRREKRTKVPAGLAVIDVPIAVTVRGPVVYEKKRIVLYREVASPNR